ncbi:MAG: DUF4115 domain-containing protein [Alphaproteobacteria bacterium]
MGGGRQRVDLSTVGAMLRETRERYGLTLRDVANALRIRVVYLHALEEGRFADLPGRPYVIGFLRSYADYFGLDGDEVVRRYREERSDTGKPAALVFPEPPESRFPVTAMVAILVVVSIVGYGVWQVFGSGDTADRPMVAEVPPGLANESDAIAGVADELAAGAPLTGIDGSVVAAGPTPPATTVTRSMAGAAASDPVADDEAPKDVATAEPETVVEESRPVIEFSSASAASLGDADDLLGGSLNGAVAPAAPGPALSPSLLGFPGAGDAEVPEDLELYDPAVVAAIGGQPSQVPASVQALEAEATAVYGDVNTDARVLLRATADCWIQITDGNGAEVFTRLLKAGEIYKVPNRDDLLLRMGNAGGLEVLVDGATLPPLGGAGEVKRNVSLAPDSLAASL